MTWHLLASAVVAGLVVLIWFVPRPRRGFSSTDIRALLKQDKRR